MRMIWNGKVKNEIVNKVEKKSQPARQVLLSNVLEGEHKLRPMLRTKAACSLRQWSV